MATEHAWCTVHGIAYNRRFERVCPQCTLARIPPGPTLDFDARSQQPIDAAGKLLDPFTLEPAG